MEWWGHFVSKQRTSVPRVAGVVGTLGRSNYYLGPVIGGGVTHKSGSRGYLGSTCLNERVSTKRDFHICPSQFKFGA